MADNKHNLEYFEGVSMPELYSRMEAWQRENQKRFLAASVHLDRGMFCCIVLTNPMEVQITDGTDSAFVSSDHALYVTIRD